MYAVAQPACPSNTPIVVSLTTLSAQETHGSGPRGLLRQVSLRKKCVSACQTAHKAASHNRQEISLTLVYYSDIDILPVKNALQLFARVVG